MLMGKPAVTSLIELMKSSVANFAHLIELAKRTVWHRTHPGRDNHASTQYSRCRLDQHKPTGLNCRVQLTKQIETNAVFDVFTVQIWGVIPIPADLPGRHTTLRISIMDVTDIQHRFSLINWLKSVYKYTPFTLEQLVGDKAKPVYARVKQWQLQDSPVFCYHTELGKLPRSPGNGAGSHVTISDWTSVANLRLDRLVLPRKGNRKLLFNLSILSGQTGKELAFSRCSFTYENPAPGYIDLQENAERIKRLAVALAFAVSAADKKLFEGEIELIKNWARNNLLENAIPTGLGQNLKQAPNKAERKLEKALDKTVAFFRDGNQLNTYKICKELVEIAPLADRYDILELCLYVAQASGYVTSEELTILKNLANWLEVDTNRFHEMTERILPVNRYQVKDVEVILGVTSDMEKEQVRQQLNKLFSKWNSRVTNSNPEIQAQADQMLKLIAETRNKGLLLQQSHT